MQQDGGLILAVGAPGASSVADGLRRFAVLEKCPGDFHHYRLTRASLWRAASAGVTGERIADFLARAARAPLPPAVARQIAEALGRYGRLRLVREGGAYWLRASDLALWPDLLPELPDEIRPSDGAPGARGLPVPVAARAPLQAHLARRGWPVRDEAGAAEGLPLRLGWRDGVALRPYQRDAIAAFAGGGPGDDGRSGLIILPCGAGKTLVGIGASVAAGRQTLVLCPNATSTRQWRDAFAAFTDLPPGAIGEYGPRNRALTPVTITTYQMLTARGAAARGASDAPPRYPHLERLGGHDWGLVIFDEAHLLPASVFRLAAELASRRRLGLTATPIREDGREADLGALVGPVLYDAPWGMLEEQGWIAPVECYEVRVPLAVDASRDISHKLAATAPEKWPVIRRLVRRHRGEGVLVLGQYVEHLRALAADLGAPLVSGAMPTAERDALFGRFRAGEEPVLVLSRVGNAAVDLPNARVAIEVSGLFGSRQEEAQRLGRLLRPKPGEAGAARFYAVVADTPAELACAARRQRFLIEQGYRYRIVRATPTGT